MRPTREQIAEARANAVRFLAANPTHELAPMLRVLVGGLAPPTKEEAIPVMVKHANEAGDWAPQHMIDESNAREALREPKKARHGFRAMVWAQWATLVHFYGGAKMGHTDPDELLNTIPTRERLEPRQFDPNPDEGH